MKYKPLRSILKFLLHPVGVVLHKTGIMRKKFILKMDGGIASQIHFYLIGRKLAQLNDVDVVYDLIWFDEVGKDIDGKHTRNFDLLKLSPHIDFKEAKNNWSTKLYRLLFTHEQDWNLPAQTWKSLTPPLYLTGYYAPDDNLYENLYDSIPLEPRDPDPDDLLIAEDIKKSENSVGLHVRRGDLSRFIEAYGQPAPIRYFYSAVETLQDLYGENIKIFIFSDDHDWVKTILLPSLPKGDYHLMEDNGPDRGYMDLWLLSHCRHYIASTGSFGKFAAMLNPDHGDVIINDSPESRIWEKRIENVRFI